jgi:methylglutaconyl-CoA hydratase
MALVDTDFARGVLTVVLNDPEHKNALGRQLTRELVAAFDAADADPAVRAVVLTNAGNTFCAGANLSERSSGDPAEANAKLDPWAIFGRVRTSPKPYVGKINGHCVAGGMGLAAAMDISVALDTAKFGFTEVRIGVVPAMISVVCLPKMRHADAQAAFLRGNRFSAVEAARMGLITAAVPAEQLDAEVDAILDDLRAAGPNALAQAKRLLAEVPNMTDVDGAFRWTAQMSAEMFASDEAKEGMRAFLEKRPPAWLSAG